MMLKKFIKKIMRCRPIVNNVTFSNFENHLKNRQYVVIGGGSGIGKAISETLIKSGANVIIASRQDHKVENCQFEFLDCEDLFSIKPFLEKIIEKYGLINGVINCQGICPKSDYKQDVKNIDIEDFERVIRINLESVYFITKIMCEYFIEKSIKGHILNIASTEGLKGCVVPYGISKAGVISLTKGFAKKYAPYGIVVNAIAPGATATSMIYMNSENDLRKEYIPSQRATTVDEIAQMANFMLSDKGDNMCGSIVVIDGGESLK